MLNRMIIPVLVYTIMLAIVLGILTVFLAMIFQQFTHAYQAWAGACFYVLSTYSAVMLYWVELRQRYQSTATRLYYMRLFDDNYLK